MVHLRFGLHQSALKKEVGVAPLAAAIRKDSEGK
jgi:hypothetical protein